MLRLIKNTTETRANRACLIFSPGRAIKGFVLSDAIKFIGLPINLSYHFPADKNRSFSARGKITSVECGILRIFSSNKNDYGIAYGVQSSTITIDAVKFKRFPNKDLKDGT